MTKPLKYTGGGWTPPLRGGYVYIYSPIESLNTRVVGRTHSAERKGEKRWNDQPTNRCQAMVMFPTTTFATMISTSWGTSVFGQLGGGGKIL